MGTRVRAISAGSFNGSRVRPGTEFTLPDGVKPGHWLEVLEVDVPSKPKKEVEAEQKAAAAAKVAKEAADAAAKNAELRGLTSAPAKGGGKVKPAEDLV